MLLDVIEELDHDLFNGTQINERKAAICVNYLLTRFGLSLHPRGAIRNLPIVLRNVYVNLRDDTIRGIFKFLTGQSGTELDILLFNVPSVFGHRTANNFYVEVEMHEREAHAFQRLIDFSDFCNDRGFNIFPILVTNQRKTEIHKNISVVRFEELQKMAAYSLQHLSDPSEIPGLAYDNASFCLFILDLLSQQYRTNKIKLLEKLQEDQKLRRKAFDFHALTHGETKIEKLLISEDLRSLRRRITGNDGYIKKLKELDYVKDLGDNRLRLTVKGSKLLLKWRGRIA